MDNYDKWFYRPLEKEDEEEENSRVYQCDWCGNWIHEGEEFLELGNVEICKDCIDENIEVA